MGRPRLSASGSGRTPTHHTSVRVGTKLAVGEADAVGVGLLDGRAHPDVEPRSRSTVARCWTVVASSSGSTWSAVSSSIQRTGCAGEPRLGRDVVRQQLTLRRDLGAGVAGADDHERAPGGALRRVVGRGRELDLPDDVVAQVERLGIPRKPCACSATPGIGRSLFTLPAASTSRS